MTTITQITKDLIEERMLVDEYLKEGIINYAALAEKFQPRIEEELGKEVKISTIAMALRRYGDTFTKKSKTDIPSLKGSELILRGDICDIVVYKSRTLFEKLKKINELVDYSKGERLNIIHGTYHVSIIISEKLLKKCLAILKDEQIAIVEKDLVALTLKLDQSFLYVPGTTFLILKQLVLQNINLIETVSSLLEIRFIISKKDGTKGYMALQDLIEM